MKRKIAAVVLSLIMAASVVSCGSSNKEGGVTETTTKAASTTKKTTASEKKEETTTTAKKKDEKKKSTKKKSKSDSSETDSKNEKDTSKVDSKETTITTLSTKETMLETLATPDYDTGLKNAESLGWTKSIYDKYTKNKDDQQKFLKSLTLKELGIVLSNYSEAQVQVYYDQLHSIGGGNQGGAAEQPVTETPQTNIDPGIKVDMTEGSDLKKVYEKYNVNLNYLLEITGLTKENFFYLWNNQNDKVFKDNITNLLYGKNSYDNGGVPHAVVNNKIDIQLVSAYWDTDGKLHTLCSLVSGYQGLAYNIVLDNIEVHNGNKFKIAQLQVGNLTKHADIDLEAGTFDGIEGMGYGEEIQLEFVFDRYHISKQYADIRSNQNIKLSYTCRCDHFDTSTMSAVEETTEVGAE